MERQYRFYNQDDMDHVSLINFWFGFAAGIGSLIIIVGSILILGYLYDI